MCKKLFTLFFSVLLLCAFTLPAYSSPGDEAKPQNGVIVYYFHGNFRCPTCFKMEQYSRGAVEEYFKDELASGKILFKAVNTDEKGNKHFVDDYRLYTKSLIISLVKDSREVKSANLAKIWEYAWDKQKFYDYVKMEVESYLKEL